MNTDTHAKPSAAANGTDAPPQRRFLVVVDGTPESHIALRFASRQVMDDRGTLSLIAVVEPKEFQHWLGVKSTMHEEDKDAVEDFLRQRAIEARTISGTQPEQILLEGDKIEELLSYVSACRKNDAAVFLVLAAAVGEEGPRSLVSTLLGDREGGGVPIPVIVVPGDASSEQIRLFC